MRLTARVRQICENEEDKDNKKERQQNIISLSYKILPHVLMLLT